MTDKEPAEVCPLCGRDAAECKSDPCPAVQNSTPLLSADERANLDKERGVGDE